MSGLVEVENRGEQSQAGIPSYCDDVFSSLQGSDQVEGLRNRFKLMQTQEHDSGHLTDLYLNHLAPIRRFPIGQSTNTASTSRKMGEVSRMPPPSYEASVASLTRRENDDRRTSSKSGVSPKLIRYAYRTVSDSISTGIKESSSCEMSVTFEVPRIVINSAPDVNASGSGASSSISGSKLEDPPYSTPERCVLVEDANDKFYHENKFPGKHHMKNYYRPYCIISRRHYTCRTYTQRHRKYGVSQRSADGGVDELVQLLDQMATGDGKKKVRQSTPVKSKWQYSPPPKYCMIRYKPHTKLTGIKERSKSLDDLHLQNSKISQTPRQNDPKKIWDSQQPGKAVSQVEGPLLEKEEVANSGIADLQIGQVMTGIRNLSMFQ